MSREGIDRVHNERMDALNKAYKYTELANNMLFMSEARHALENLRIAILQENVDYQKHMKVLAEEEMMML
jgi:hypothetical protein